MAYGEQHLLYSFTGTMPGGEVWSCGVRTSGALGPTDQVTLDALATNGVVQWSTFHATAANVIGSGVIFDLCTVRVISTAGITVGQSERSPASPVAGSGSVNKPNQCAVVVTLITAVAGRRGRGRFYVPVLGGTITGANRVAPTQRDSLADTAAAMLSGINDGLDNATYAARVGVQSQTGLSDAVVTSIRVGDVWDTQRRRRDNIIESYTSRAVTP